MGGPCKVSGKIGGNAGNVYRCRATKKDPPQRGWASQFNEGGSNSTGRLLVTEADCRDCLAAIKTKEQNARSSRSAKFAMQISTGLAISRMGLFGGGKHPKVALLSV